MNALLEFQAARSTLVDVSTTIDTDCQDCLVGLICSAEHDDAVIVDAAEARAMRMLASAGLLGNLRHVHQAS